MADKDFLKGAYVDRSDDETQALYDDWAQQYDRDMDRNDYAQPRRCAQALLNLTEDRNAPVLDVGCGTGLSGLALKAAGFAHVDGCDYSDAMLQRAGRTGAYDRLFPANLNAPPLDAADGAYQAATCVGVFSFGHVSPDSVDEILRVVRPGGPVIIGLNELFWQKGDLRRKLEALQDAGALEILSTREGDHLPGEGLKGWVIQLRKR